MPRNEDRDYHASRRKEERSGARDIGAIPEIVNAPRRSACLDDFRLFCESYLPEQFPLAWSDDHLEVIRLVEGAVLRGELFAMAMPRGSGKTTLVASAAMWALLYGHRRYVTIIGSDENAAERIMTNIAAEMEVNDLLLEDFPESCFPIRSLEGIGQRAKGQEQNGKRTRIEWTAKGLVFPTLYQEDGRPYPTSGSVVDVAGITGRVRGRNKKTADGKIMRPDLVLIDDPSTNESAKSPSQNADRLRVIASDIMGLSGPGKKIAGLCTVTVIYPDDLADQILNREMYPQWQGKRAKLLYEEPTNKKLWDEYATLRLRGFKEGVGLSLATAFYAQNRAEMDKGSRVAWPQRFNSDEISALQHCMNLQFTNKAAFLSEYQNEPLPAHKGAGAELQPDNIQGRLSGIPHCIIPDEATRLVSFIDVQKKLLYYVVAAFTDNMQCSIVDYGVWPEQPTRSFTAQDARKTLQRKYPGGGLEAQIKHGLQDLSSHLFDRCWRTEGGMTLGLERVLIDANWGDSTEAVREFCKRSQYSNQLLPTHGRYVGASGNPFNDYKKQRGDRVGMNWRIPAKQSKVAGVRYGLYDTNFWKTFAAERLLCDSESNEALRLYGHDAAEHRMIAEHWSAEYRIHTVGRGRELDEWKLPPDKSENHWWDCLIGCFVAASMQGASPEGISSSSTVDKPPSRAPHLPMMNEPGLGSLGGW